MIQLMSKHFKQIIYNITLAYLSSNNIFYALQSNKRLMSKY